MQLVFKTIMINTISLISIVALLMVDYCVLCQLVSPLTLWLVNCSVQHFPLPLKYPLKLRLIFVYNGSGGGDGQKVDDQTIKT